MDHNHFKNGLGGGKELPHDHLQELLALQFGVLRGECDLELVNHLGVLLFVSVHDGSGELVDGLEDELAESTREGFARDGGVAGSPLLAFGIEVVVTPQSAHELFLGDTKLGGVELGESAQSETPSLESTTETNGTLVGEYLDITQQFVVVCGDNHVHGLNSLTEALCSTLVSQPHLKAKRIITW